MFCRLFLPLPFCSAHSPTGPRSTLAPGHGQQPRLSRRLLQVMDERHSELFEVLSSDEERERNEDTCSSACSLRINRGMTDDEDDHDLLAVMDAPSDTEQAKQQTEELSGEDDDFDFDLEEQSSVGSDMTTEESLDSNGDEERFDVSKSPEKMKGRDVKLYNGNVDCKIITLESLDNPYVVPFLMNCLEDNPTMISSAVPSGIQDNATFILNLGALGSRKDLYSDDNGSWVMTGCKTKFYIAVKDEEGKVVELEKVNNEASSDVAVRRRTYMCSSCSSYHKTIVSIEFVKDIAKWFPLVLLDYHFDGKPTKFKVTKHGNRTSSNMPHIRTKESTKVKTAEKAEQFGPKRALFLARKEAGGICGVESISSLPRNKKQVEYLARKPAERASKDPLASVLELQKTTFPGFIREVVCNDLPTVMLFTDRQLNNIVKFCGHNKADQVSELGVDVTFQLGPFYLLTTTFKNTVLRVKGANNHPSFLGPVMICMTKEETTYLSFIHCLNREIPGLSEFLHATGTDDERALTNALAAGFRHATPLLCYIHCQRNIKEKCRKLGLSSALVSRICQDLFKARTGLVWSNCQDEFDKNATAVMEEWETLERSEKVGPPAFAEYFRTHKLDDMRSKMAAYVMKDLGLGKKPYEQNVPESVNDMMKDWTKFVPQDMDKFIVTLYDFVQSFDQEEDLAWFQLSDKWEVCHQFQQHLPKKSHAEMSPEERKSVLQKINKVCLDPVAYKRCRNFKITPFSSTASGLSAGQSVCDINNLAPLSALTSQSLRKSQGILHNEQFRKAFQDRVYFVDSGGPLPHRVQCLKSGKCSCDCHFFGRNNICHHCLAVAIHLDCVAKVAEAYKGRNLTKISTATAPRNVGGKAPSRKQRLDASEVVALNSTNEDATNSDESFQAEAVNPTTLVIRRSTRPIDPPSNAPLVLKKISGNIRKCAGCSQAIKSNVVGYQSQEDQQYCFGRFESYHFWNKDSKAWQPVTSTRHYHLNPVCTKVASKITTGSVVVNSALRELIVDRFGCDLD